MKAVIMAGGEGTRLRPLTCERPKPMVPVLNVPVMEHIINLLRHHGITDIAVTLQYLPEKIKNYFQDGSKFGVKLTYSVEDSPLGTAGSVKKIEDFLDDTFLVISGDALTDFNLTQIIDFHKRKKALATLTLTTSSNPLEFGIVLTDYEGRITRFLEKPSLSEVFSDTINTGIYVMEPDILSIMEPYRKYDFSKDIFPYLLKEKHGLYGVVAGGYWCDIGNLTQYKQANIDSLYGKVNLHGIQGLSDDQVTLGSGSYISKEAKISGPILLGRNCKVHRGVEILGPTVIGDDCIVDMGASIEESLIWNGVYLGEKTKLAYSQIGSQCLIKEGSVLKENSFVGDSSVIEEGCTIKAETKIWPNKLILKGTTVAGSIVNMSNSASLFGRQGLTGVANFEISPDLAVKIGAAYGSLLNLNSTVILSRDGRPYSQLIAKALEAGLQATGINIVDLAKSPVALNSFAITTKGASAGIHICTSNRNPNVITLIFLDEQGIEIATSTKKELESMLAREEFRRVAGNQITATNSCSGLETEYLNRLFSLIDKENIASKGFKIALNYSDNFTKDFMKDLFKQLNCEVTSFNSAVETSQAFNSFNNIRWDSAVLVDESHRNFRLLSNTGELLSSEQIQAIFTYLTLKRSYLYPAPSKKKIRKIVTTSRTSQHIDKLCSLFMGKIQRSKAGARALKQCCLEKGVILGGDAKAGLIFPEFSISQDALVATLILLDFLAQENITLQSLLNYLPDMEMFKATIECTLDAQSAFMRRLLEEVKGKSVELSDGIKLFNNDDWFLVLPDPDQPLLHIYGEYESAAGQSFIEDSMTMVKKIAEETNAG